VVAAQRAIESPLLEASVHGAQGVLINITGGSDMSLYEVHEASSAVQMAAHPEAQIIFGAVIEEQMRDAIRVTVIATGFAEAAAIEEPAKAAPVVRRRADMPITNSYTEPASAAAYEVHEKFDPDAYARWQAFSKNPQTPEQDSVPDERTLEVPAFFRRRSRRR
jgi:cell division protein FtsZ